MNTKSMAEVLVLGAGIGGLTAAIYSALNGRQVLVVEKNRRVGGKMHEYNHAGFRWDTGPSVITMRPVLENLFIDAGRKLEDYLYLQPLKPLTRYFYADKTVLDASSDLSIMLPQIAKLDAQDVEGYLQFLAYVSRLHRITGPVFIYDPPPTPASFLKVSPLDYMKIDPFRNMQQAINGYIRSPHIRQLLGRYATYVGANPYQAPATLNVIAHVELNQGVFYPQGGVYQIAMALKQLASELGVRIETEKTISQILVKEGKVIGAEDILGNQFLAPVVIANIDYGMVHQQLLPADTAQTKLKNRLSTDNLSCSGYIMLLGIRGTHPQLVHHNIFFSGDSEREFQQIFMDHTPADEPTIYLAITAKTDPDHAPPGHENWFILVNAPPANQKTNWQVYTQHYRQTILAQLARYGFDIEKQICHEKIITPIDLEKQSGAWRGALYGFSSNTRMAAFKRPHNRDPHIQGLYYCGGTTHPGGGVPMVILSGRNAARMASSDFVTAQ